MSDLPDSPSGRVLTILGTSRRSLRWVIRRALLTSPVAGLYSRPDPDGEAESCGITEDDAKAIAEHVIATLEADTHARWSRPPKDRPPGIVSVADVAEDLDWLYAELGKPGDGA